MVNYLVTIRKHSVWIHTHTCLTALFLGLPRWTSTRKVNQSGFYWSKRQWVAVVSAGPYASLHLAPDDNHTSTPPLSFLQAGRPSCHPTNSVKALKAYEYKSFKIWHLAQSKLHPNQNSSTIKQLLNCDYDASTPVKITVTQRFLSGTQTASNFIAGQLHVKPFQKNFWWLIRTSAQK